VPEHRAPAGRTALAIVMLTALALLTASPAAADRCAPPGVSSASALPTNLGAAAKGPDVDKYTTATTEPLSSVDINELRLITPGKTERLQHFLDQVL
jgi:polar amino acid transport system substrate-binding protein